MKWLQVLFFTAIVVAVGFLSYNIWEGQVITAFSIFLTISGILIVFIIFIENRDPSQTLNWILVFAIFPVLGFFFYLLFGRNYAKTKRFEQKKILDEQAFDQIEGNKQLVEHELNQMGDHQRMFFRLAHHLGKSPISFSSETKVLTNGDETFPAIKKALREAKHHIHMEYYIVRDDELGREIKDILVEKAKEGVEVRFLFDAVGSWRLSSDFKQDLIKAGVEIQAFASVKFPVIGNKLNYRNHRKIIVIDGEIGFTGGLNIGDEYMGKDSYFGKWRDTHLYVRGESVRSLQLIFIQDWHYETNQSLLTQEYLSPEMLTNEDLGGVQMIAGGPDSQWEVIKKLYFSMIISAKKSISIASPYVIPDDDILTALKVASLSGVDVKILTPARPDKRIVFHASRSYFPELMDAGIRIYEYKEGFMHSKIVIVDEELASIGTSNMDMRSFHLNFEVNAFLFRTESTAKLVEDFQHDIEIAEELEPDRFKKRPITLRVMESLFRLMSPLL